MSLSEPKQSNVERLKLMANAELEYVAAWEEARREQNALQCDMEAKKLEKTLNDLRTREKNMERVHKAKAKFLTLEIEVSRWWAVKRARGLPLVKSLKHPSNESL